MIIETVLHKGGCHCGRVRFELEAPPVLLVSECNCSICTKSGFAGFVVPKRRFRLLEGRDCLAVYAFGTGVAGHTFCRHCGVKSFYYPRSHPDGVSVNFRCLDPGTVERADISVFDGQNWEAQYPQGRAPGYANFPGQ